MTTQESQYTDHNNYTGQMASLFQSFYKIQIKSLS